MAGTSAAEKTVSPIIVPGQLVLRTIHGRNGKFNVGKLVRISAKVTGDFGAS